jgi:hypothetical protein
MHFFVQVIVALNPALPFCKTLAFVFLPAIIGTSKFGVCPSNKHYPFARRAYAANVMGKDLDIFALGAVSLSHIFTQQPKIINNVCSYSYCSVLRSS